MIQHLQTYLRESLGEMKKVNWLPWKDAWLYTLQVILFSLTLAIIFGILDILFSSTIIRL